MYESPEITRPESNSPVGPSDALPAANVCETISVFENNTTSPRFTVVWFGMKHPSWFFSHPGVPDPFAGLIMASYDSSIIDSSTTSTTIPLMLTVEISSLLIGIPPWSIQSVYVLT